MTFWSGTGRVQNQWQCQIPTRATGTIQAQAPARKTKGADSGSICRPDKAVVNLLAALRPRGLTATDGSGGQDRESKVDNLSVTPVGLGLVSLCSLLGTLQRS
jgi:hypothetical protein